MALEDKLSGIQLRGVLAIVARAAERVLVLAGKASGSNKSCRDGIALASYFAAGAPAPILWRLETLAAAKALKSANGNIFAIEAVRSTALAGDKAFQAASANRGFMSSETVEEALLCAKQAISSVEKGLGGTALEAPVNRDLASVRKTHSGKATEFGQAIDPSERGPLGFLWVLGEEPSWLIAEKEAMGERQRPKLYLATGHDNTDHIRKVSPDFVCFYIPLDLDEESLTAIIGSIEAISQRVKPRPGFVVYAQESKRPELETQKLETARQLRLISAGAIVLTGKIGGGIPRNADEFEQALGYWLSHTLLVGEQDREGSTTTSVVAGSGPAVTSGTPMDGNVPVNPEELNARYKSLLDRMNPSLHQLSMS